MATIVVIFTAGILTGWIFRKSRFTGKSSSVLTFLSVLALLFILGYQAGHNPEVQAHFDKLGYKAFIIGALSTSGSILFIMVYSKLMHKK